MLGTKTKPRTKDSSHLKAISGAHDTGETCVMTNGTTTEGKFRATENVRLDGLLKGEMKCDKRLVMGEKGKVEGNIETVDAVIMGTVDGELKVSGSLTLKGTAIVRGVITAKFMIVEEGAQYFGDCNIG